MNLLLIEDDIPLGQGVVASLTDQGHRVEWFQDGRLGLMGVQQLDADLIILDLTLPELDGISLLKQARGEGVRTPVLILTARDSIEDRIIGLDAGADDYLLKPFSLAELEARVRALYRRSCGRAEELINYQTLTVDPTTRQVLKEGKDVNLSRKEFQLLLRLLEAPGRVLTRSKLEALLYGEEEEVESNALEVHIHNLRKKLGKTLIQTVRGVGYRVPKP